MGISTDRRKSTVFTLLLLINVLTFPRRLYLFSNVQSMSGYSPKQLNSHLSSLILSTDASQRLTKINRKNQLLQKQLNDLGWQVQTLLEEIAGQQDPTIPSDEELEADEGIAPAENINEVLFRNIPALQAQNQKLLGIVHKMGAKMEAEEREYREVLEKE